jgi:uracil-DNA glycosylase family 4
MSAFCPICLSNGMRTVPGNGPQPCKVLALGEGPGGDELRYLVPFVGKAGRELNGLYLPLAGLTRENIRVSNVTLTAFPGLRNPEPEEAAECARHHLPRELLETNPDYIVTLGAVALSVFGDWDLETYHGRPITEVEYGGWQGTLFPVYHPAAGLRQPRFQVPLYQDFEDLGKWRRGRLPIPVDQHPNPVYRELRTPDDFRLVTRDLPSIGLEIGTDTETVDGKFYCVTVSTRPGMGWLVMHDNHDLIRLYKEWLLKVRPLLIFHAYLADEPVYAEAGLPIERFTDTCQTAYEIGLPALGLKVLAHRCCGMVMQEYEDLVMPYGLKEATDYLRLAVATELKWFIEDLPWKPGKRSCSGAAKYGGRHPSTNVVFTSPVAKQCPNCTKVLDPPKMTRDKGGRQFIWDRARRILSDMEEKPKTNPMDRWAKIPEEERAPMEVVIGRMPKPSLAQVPHDKLLFYSVRDADATLRLKPVLYRMAAELGRKVRRGY